uniref:Selenoprotein H n=1 Tax=Electrophorus electricus TaxID=8005 RepID=A0A4W4G3Y0_ELEEL
MFNVRTGRGSKRTVDPVAEPETVTKKYKADERAEDDLVREALVLARPGLRVLLNPHKPRRNSFEITLSNLFLFFSLAETVLWTGIKKGPPRKLKFPDPAEVVNALEDALNSK